MGRTRKRWSWPCCTTSASTPARRGTAPSPPRCSAATSRSATCGCSSITRCFRTTTSVNTTTHCSTATRASAGMDTRISSGPRPSSRAMTRRRWTPTTTRCRSSTSSPWCGACSAQNRDRADLDQVIRRGELAHLDHGRGWRGRLEILAAHLVDLVEVLHVAHIDVDAADVVQRAAGGLDRGFQVLAHLARLRLDVADAGDGPIRAPRGHAGDEHQLAPGLDLDRLRKVARGLADLVAGDWILHGSQMRKIGSVPLIKQGERVVGGHHIAELLDHVLEGREMLLVRERSGAVAQQHDLVVEHHRVARGGFAADVGLGACDEQRIDAALLQERAEVGSAGDERAVAVLRHPRVAGRDVELAPGLLQLVTRGKGCSGTRSVFWSYENIKEIPVTRILVQHPDHRHAAPAQLGHEAIDAGHDVARAGHFDRRAGGDERVLQVDDEQRGALRIEAVEQVQPPAPREHALDDLLADRDFVHQNFSSQGLRSTSKLQAERCCRYTAIYGSAIASGSSMPSSPRAWARGSPSGRWMPPSMTKCATWMFFGPNSRARLCAMPRSANLPIAKGADSA